MYKQLISEQRYTIEVLLKQNWKKKDIAAAIGVSVSTVYRETSRNKGKHGTYTHGLAQELADMRKERLPGNRKIPKRVTDEAVKLLREEQWSPEQISGWMALKGVRISHETIYKIIRRDKIEGGELYKSCRHQLKNRKRPVGAVGRIPNRVSIHDRPAEADGKRFGDWEMDLIVDKDQNGILTMIERSTVFLLMAKLKHGKMAMPVAKTAWRLLLPYKGEQLHTITTDNGSEFAAHEWLTKQLGAQIYFTDSYASWQKGAVENTNKLIRQYIPKGMDISTVSDRRIASIQAKINRRPRAKLNFNTPKDEFFKHYS
jgi:IS30 family transposase